jgi:hypothetical protein
MKSGLLFLIAAVGGSLWAQTLTFGVIGDPGTGKAGQFAVARQMEKWAANERWQFILSLGDNVYQNGRPQRFEARFKKPYRKLVESGVPVRATLGNHDRRYQKGMAQVADSFFGFLDGQDEYMFEAGPVVDGKRLARFLTINSDAWIAELHGGRETPGLGERVQRLERWLATSGRYHWNILYLHHPLYSYVRSGGFLWSRGHGSATELREYLEKRLVGRVDLVLAGHDHFYQKIRSQKGIHHVVSGAAGQVRAGALVDHPEVEFAAERLHFLSVEISPDAIRYRAVSDGGEEIDARRLVKVGVRTDAPSLEETAR